MIWIVALAILVLLMWPRRVVSVHVECQQHPRRYEPPPAIEPIAPPLVKWRPPMAYRPDLRQWECPCGGIETDRARMMRTPAEHDCALEIWR